MSQGRWGRRDERKEWEGGKEMEEEEGKEEGERKEEREGRRRAILLVGWQETGPVLVN